MKTKIALRKYLVFGLLILVLTLATIPAFAYRWHCGRCSENVIDCSSGTCVPYHCEMTWWDTIVCWFS